MTTREYYWTQTELFKTEKLQEFPMMGGFAGSTKLQWTFISSVKAFICMSSLLMETFYFAK